MAKNSDSEKYKIPFHPVSGDLIDYVHHFYQYGVSEKDEYGKSVVDEDGVVVYKKPDWRDNYVFSDTLVYSGYSRGRSSAKFCFTGKNNVRYEMFMKDFDDMMNSVGFNDGSGRAINGFWTFIKRGRNYGIKYVHTVVVSLPKEVYFPK